MKDIVINVLKQTLGVQTAYWRSGKLHISHQILVNGYPLYLLPVCHKFNELLSFILLLDCRIIYLVRWHTIVQLLIQEWQYRRILQIRSKSVSKKMIYNCKFLQEDNKWSVCGIVFSFWRTPHYNSFIMPLAETFLCIWSAVTRHYNAQGRKP